MNEAEAAERDLKFSLNETEPCATPIGTDGRVNDPEKWVGAWTNSTSPEIARQLCTNEDGTPCHVLLKCLKFAILNDEKDFIYGGMTPAERQEIANGTRRFPVEKTDAGLDERTNTEDTTA